ncbi:hypothetical protein [Effusibacillus lacus]|uniref:Uncharacterized protein n=1 Tax=Effusibacillus lacus TaxID=1348429 RepID=A0A292YN87_9BACL|nr:hypothetical protein [Effusibacillus lacus]TCS72307.1 hypothetical protein EDD64_12260 [Effusibacillus lacus]GAX90223.1 hypothetical protein EFBL_1849 [Effusibacillus lacus]
MKKRSKKGMKNHTNNKKPVQYKKIDGELVQLIQQPTAGIVGRRGALIQQPTAGIVGVPGGALIQQPTAGIVGVPGGALIQQPTAGIVGGYGYFGGYGPVVRRTVTYHY